MLGEYHFGIASLLNKKELLQEGDPVNFQVGNKWYKIKLEINLLFFIFTRAKYYSVTRINFFLHDMLQGSLVA